jgi:hypothetical protein
MAYQYQMVRSWMKVGVTKESAVRDKRGGKGDGDNFENYLRPLFWLDTSSPV